MPIWYQPDMGSLVVTITSPSNASLTTCNTTSSDAVTVKLNNLPSASGQTLTQGWPWSGSQARGPQSQRSRDPPPEGHTTSHEPVTLVGRSSLWPW